MRFLGRFGLMRCLWLSVLVFGLIGARSEAEQVDIAKLRDRGVAA